MSDYTTTEEYLICAPRASVRRAVRNQAYRLFGGPVADTTVDKVLAVLIGIGALDEDALDRAVEAWGDRGLA